MPSLRIHARTLAHQPSSVHQPERPAPFLYVSGHLNPTAQGIVESIRYGGYDVDVYDYQSGAFFGIALHLFPALGFFRFDGESRPTHQRVARTVGWLTALIPSKSPKR